MAILTNVAAKLSLWNVVTLVAGIGRLIIGPSGVSNVLLGQLFF